MELLAAISIKTEIRVRRAEPADYAGFARSMSTPRAYAGTLQLPMPSLEMWRERLAKADPETFLYVAEVPVDNGSKYEIVGHLSLSQVHKNPRRRHAYSIGISVVDEWQGRGVGTALMKTAVDMADNWLQVLRLELTVFSDNDGGVALYRKFGFEIEGTLRSYAFRNGVYADAYSMARLHPNLPGVHPASAPT